MILFLFLLPVIFFIYSCCVVSSRCEKVYAEKKIKIVKISEFETRDSTKKFLDELSMLTKLNTIYEKKLITKNEYEKIRSTFKYVA